MQVSTTASGLVCNCRVFRSQVSTADRKCLHTMHLLSRSQAQSAQAFAALESVVPIRPSISSNAQPYAYWFDDSFVTISPVSQTLRCSHASHKSRCDRPDAVKQYLSSSASTDGVDNDELDFLQVIHTAATLHADSICGHWYSLASACDNDICCICNLQCGHTTKASNGLCCTGSIVSALMHWQCCMSSTGALAHLSVFQPRLAFLCRVLMSMRACALISLHSQTQRTRELRHLIQHLGCGLPARRMIHSPTQLPHLSMKPAGSIRGAATPLTCSRLYRVKVYVHVARVLSTRT